jgi:hypothetical protein
MGLTQASAPPIERSEAREKIQLDTLRWVPDALDCDLLYALVPRTGLESTLRVAAQRKLDPHLRAVAQTMRLEDQGSSPEAELLEDEITRLIASGNSAAAKPISASNPPDRCRPARAVRGHQSPDRRRHQPG